MLGDVKLAVRDPNEADRLAIERILHQVSEQHKKFRHEEDLLFEELKQDIKKQQGNQKPDIDVLKQQIVGLQLLSTDLDLPPDLQTAYLQSLETNPNAESETIDSQALIEALSDPACFSGDFVRRARALGAIGNDYSHQSSLSDSSKLHFEKVVANKLANRIRELESLPSNLGTFHEGSSELDDSLKINALVELSSLQAKTTQTSHSSHRRSVSTNRACGTQRCSVDTSGPTSAPRSSKDCSATTSSSCFQIENQAIIGGKEA